MSGDVLLVWRNGQHPYRVRVSGLTMTTQINAPGQLTALLPARDLGLYPFGGDWKGLRCRYDHPTLPRWEGVIVDDQPASAIGTIDLVAESPSSMLQARRLASTYLPIMGTGPALIKAAVEAAGARRHLPLTVRATSFGRPMLGDARADDLLSYVQSVATDAGCEWIDGVDDDGVWYLEVGPRIGADKTHRVHLIENANCTDVTAPGSLRTVVNDLLAIGDDLPYAAAARTVVSNPDSMTKAWGRREGTIRYTGVTAQAGLEPLAAADVRRLGTPPIAVTLRMAATAAIVAEMRLGDLVRLTSGTANREYILRLTMMTVTDSGRILAVTGDARIVDESKGWTWRAA